MNEPKLRQQLASIPLGGLQYFTSIGSTNDEALAWSEHDAQDLSLIVAEEQTAGRGRSGRKWFTPPNSALAFSLILRPTKLELAQPTRTTGLGALALVECLRKLGLQSQIKWPNDVLIKGRKVAGILVESGWTGTSLDSLILGMGVNVLTASEPPADQVSFPATSLESELGKPIDRTLLLKEILSALIKWRPQVGSRGFLEAWEKSLAFFGQEVLVQNDNELPRSGRLMGLEPDGSLRLLSNNRSLTIHFGDLHLRPTDDKINQSQG
jgi:BirA family transcriptional regulator, biotin operon repressor / biotin---[acetyl-CoA-carboxylase] ligase